MARRLKRFVVLSGRRLRCLIVGTRTIWDKSLSRLLQCNSLALHKAPELGRLQKESYVGVRHTLPLELAHETAL